MTDDLVAFLKACVDDEEAAAQDWERAPHTVDCGVRLGYWADPDCVCGYPARVVAEVQAKRRIIDEHSPGDPCDAHDASLRSIPCETLRLLALPYASCDGYRSEWAPA